MIYKIPSILQPVSFSYESFSLRADSGMLVHNLAFRFAIVNKLQAQLMPGNMVNTTGDLVEAYRLLPNGAMQFL